jgi:hypothetical protein
MNDYYVIWSIEHTAWWGPDRCGYSETLMDAGVDTRAEARAICDDANVVGVNEAMIPISSLAHFQMAFSQVMILEQQKRDRDAV